MGQGTVMNVYVCDCVGTFDWVVERCWLLLPSFDPGARKLSSPRECACLKKYPLIKSLVEK